MSEVVKAEFENYDKGESSEENSDKVSINSLKSSFLKKDNSIGKAISIGINPENESLEALVNRVGDYIKGHYSKNEDNLSLTVKHDLIGKFKLNVTENTDKTLDIKILTGSDDGRLFFVKNENEISNNLKNLGLKISDMKIIPGADLADDSKSSFENDKNQNSDNGKSQKYNEQSENRKDEAQKRKDLWELYKERMNN